MCSLPLENSTYAILIVDQGCVSNINTSVPSEHLWKLDSKNLTMYFQQHQYDSSWGPLCNVLHPLLLLYSAVKTGRISQLISLFCYVRY